MHTRKERYTSQLHDHVGATNEKQAGEKLRIKCGGTRYLYLGLMKPEAIEAIDPLYKPRHKKSRLCLT